MALSDQIVESQTLSTSGVGSTTHTFSNVTVTQAPGAGATGRYQLLAVSAVSSASADVVIESISYGTEDLAPDKASEPTAASRPGTRNFSAGEWPTGANDLTITVSGGDIDCPVIRLMVVDQVADACLPPYGTGLRSDTFNRLSLNPMWTLDVGGSNDASNVTATMVEDSGTFALRLDPSDASPAYLNDDRSPSVYQSVSDGDFDVTINKNPGSDIDTTNANFRSLSGLLAEDTTADDWVIGASNEGASFDLRFLDGGGTDVNNITGGLAEADTEWIQLTRSGDDFEGFSGTTQVGLTSRSTDTQTLTLTRIGVIAGKTTFSAGNSGAADFFSFINNDAAVTRDLEDSDTALEFLGDTAAAATSIELAFTEDTTAGAGLVNIAIIAADDAAGAMSAGTGDELLDDGVVSSTDGIRYAIVGALTEVSGTTAGTTIGASWAGAANASISGSQFRVEGLAGGGGIVANHALPAPTQAASVAVIAKATAAHNLPAPTQSADVGVVGKATAAHALPAPTQTAAASVIAKTTGDHSLPAPTQSASLEAIGKVSAAHALPAPVQTATAAAIAKVTAAQSLQAPTQQANISASDVGTIVANQALQAPSQTATMAAIAKATADHSLPAPAQSAQAQAIAKVSAAHVLQAPTQSASIDATIGTSIVAAQTLPAPSQSATVKPIAKATGAHALPAPIQTAALDVIEVPEIIAAHRLPAPTMAASLAVISRVAASHALPAPSQSAFVRTGERQAIALVGSLPGSTNLQGARPAISLTGKIDQQSIALSGSTPA